MKVTCVILAFVAVLNCVVGDEEHHKAYKEASHKCMEELGIEQEKLKEFYSDKSGKTEDSQIKCYLSCTMQKINWMDENGNIVDHSEDNMPKAWLDMAKECADVNTGSDSCEKAYNFHVCFLEKKQAAGHEHHNPHH